MHIFSIQVECGLQQSESDVQPKMILEMKHFFPVTMLGLC